MKATRLRFFVAVLLVGTASARGQSAIDGFNVNFNGPVRVVVVQPDGSALIGGDFTVVSTGFQTQFNRQRIVRLNPDGTLDTVFNPAANDTVRAIAVQRDGKVLIGGDFTLINGRTTRNHIARLDATTGAVDSFNPDANDFVSAIALQRDSKILVGGAFTEIAGHARARMARLDTAGAADSFNPAANGQVNAIVVQTENKILAGGAFTNIGRQPRVGIARLDATSGDADTFNPNANGTVGSIALQSDNNILAGGSFTIIGGRVRHRIARLDGTSGVADSFDPNADSDVFSIAIQSEGKILVGGAFSKIGEQTRNRIARLDTFTGLADSFDPSANNIVFSIAVQQDGKVLAGGLFSTLTPDSRPFALTRKCIARLEIDGRVDQTLDLGNIGSANILATAVQTDGKILIGGIFNSIFGIPRHNIARLNTDGTLDPIFNPNANNIVLAIAVQADGEILIAGDFTMLSPDVSLPVTRNFIARLEPTFGAPDSFNPIIDGQVSALAVETSGTILVGGTSGSFAHINGVTRHNIGRVRSDGTLDMSFDPNANGNVTTIVVQPNNKILVSGTFHSFNGGNSIGAAPLNYIARLEPTFGLADNFNPNADGPVQAIALEANGNILVGGATFTHIGGAARTNMARLDSVNGSADTSFSPNPNGRVDSIVVQADGRVLVSGAFTRIGTFPRSRIARLEPSGLADISFNPNATSSNGFPEVFALAVPADGKILAGGLFDTIGQSVRFDFARLTNDTAALQNLAMTQSTITWTRGGSSPQFSRTTFEYSNDNVNFTPLGKGAPSGSGWALSGLNLPIGRNFVIRARGFYHSGNSNGSESVLGFRKNKVISALPVIESITAKPKLLRPPNNKLVPVTVKVEASDDTDPNPKCKIVSVTFVDPPNGDDDDENGKKMKPPFEITGDLTVNLRAGPKGRVYTIVVQCKDASGHATTASTSVNVARGEHDDE